MVYILRSLAVDQENKIETRLSKTEKRKRNLVNHTIYYLETHHDEEITLEQLAEMLYVTPTYLSKTFKSGHRRWANQLFNSNPLKPCERIAEK